MNKNEFEVKWNLIRGQTPQWWSKLTNEDLDLVRGKLDQLVAVVQQKYGFARQAAEEDVQQRLGQFEIAQKRRSNLGQAPVLDIVDGQWTEMRAQVREWWGKLTDADLDKAAGRAEAVFALLQGEYGMSRDRAEAEFKRRMQEYAVSQQLVPTPITYFI